MIEISTIQDIRQIESKLIGGFTGRQLLSLFIGGIIDAICFVITHSIGLIVILSLLSVGIGFCKIRNFTVIEYAKILWDKQQQPKIRTYKNKNVIFEIERQCKIYKSKKNK